MNFLKTILLSTLTIVAVAQTQTMAAVLALFTAHNNTHRPDNTVIAFDIHDVLTKGKNLIPETWEIVRKLKAAGYPVYIFSNIGSKGYDQLKTRFPGHFDIFDGYHIMGQKGHPGKPHPQSYVGCKALIAQRHAGKNIIFIDDKKANVQAAQNAGIKGIQFSSGKQLRKDLGPLL